MNVKKKCLNRKLSEFGENLINLEMKLAQENNKQSDNISFNTDNMPSQILLVQCVREFNLPI